MKSVIILGRSVSLYEWSNDKLCDVTIGDRLTYKFYDGQYQGIPLLFLEPKAEIATPRNMAITADILQNKYSLPVVFLLPQCPAYLRQRLVDKGVFFVVSDKYAYLPTLIANERLRKTTVATTMTPVAQYLLLYHLQVNSLQGLAACDIQELVPYSYSNITLGITCLADLKLCDKVADGSKRKVLQFNENGRRLWEMASRFCINPVSERVYCDDILSQDSFTICGINALAHYSMLNSDPEKIIMMSAKQLKALTASKSLVNPNKFDGNIIVESWKYPPVFEIGEAPRYVDKLSLVLSLSEDADPRVESEVERLITNVQWKD